MNAIVNNLKQVSFNSNTTSYKDTVHNNKSETPFDTHLIKNITYKKIQAITNSYNTSFKDPTNGKTTVVSLSSKNLENIKQIFGENEILFNTDGTVTLKDKAELFVSKWFEDIAYTRKFLESDINNDGIISDEEVFNIKNVVEVQIVYSEDGIPNLSIVAYNKIKKEEIDNTSNFSTSINDELNLTLKYDINADGKLTLNEITSSIKDYDQLLEENIKKDFKLNFLDIDKEEIDKIAMLLDYMSKIFSQIELEKKMMKILNTSQLVKEVGSETANKLLSEELYQILIDNKSEDITKNKKHNSKDNKEKSPLDITSDILDILKLENIGKHNIENTATLSPITNII